MAGTRPKSKEFHVYAAETSSGWRIVRSISFVKGEAGVERGAYKRVYDECRKLVGYQIVANGRNEFDLPSTPSTPCLTAADAQAAAGVFGLSVTAGMSEDDRLSRRSITRRQLAPEDFIERSIAKLDAYTRPAPGRGDRAVRVYPKGPDSHT